MAINHTKMKPAPKTIADGLTVAKRLLQIEADSVKALIPRLGQWAQALANPLFTQTYRHHSFWLPAQAEVDLNPSSSLTVVPGLPDPDQFSLMLEGRW